MAALRDRRIFPPFSRVRIYGDVDVACGRVHNDACRLVGIIRERMRDVERPEVVSLPRGDEAVGGT